MEDEKQRKKKKKTGEERKTLKEGDRMDGST